MGEVVSITVELSVVGLFTFLAARGLVAARPGERRSYALTFPRQVTPEQVLAALASLQGLAPSPWRWLLGAPAVVLEATGTAAGIAHRLSVAARDGEHTAAQLRAAIPGLRVEATEAEPPAVTQARELVPAGPDRLRTERPAATSRGVLAALQPLKRDEALTVQWVLTPAGRPALRGLARLLRQVAGQPVEPPPRRLPEPAYVATCRVGASGKRRGVLMTRATRALGAAASDGRWLRARTMPAGWAASRLRRGVVPVLGRGVLEADELAGLLGVPLEGPQLPGLTLAGSRELAPLPQVPRRGRVLGEATLGTRPVALTEAMSRQGLLVTAPTGAGKSTLLERLCWQDFRAGRTVICIDSKGDLVDALADLVPEQRLDDVVVFDPADSRPVGFNVLGGRAGDADLLADQVVGQFRDLYGSALGPRSEMLLRAACLTLTRAPGDWTLCEVVPLLTDAALRRRLVGPVGDQALASVWGWFESQSEPAQAEMTAPLVNKLAPFTLRRGVRAVVGQATGGLDLEAAIARRGIVLIALRKGATGEDAAGLLGAALLGRLWAAIQRRQALPPARRRFVSVVLDEAQDFLRLPVAFGDAVAQSRGLGVGWTVAHQHLGQLAPEVRRAVLANLRSKLVLQATADDARAFAREFAPHLAASDLQGLSAFTGYAALATDAGVTPPASLRTHPAPEPEGHGALVRARSRARYGADPRDVERAMAERATVKTTPPVVGTRRRS